MPSNLVRVCQQCCGWGEGRSPGEVPSVGHDPAHVSFESIQF